MPFVRPAALALAAALSALAAPAVAACTCQGVSAVDACLVGAWSASSEGVTAFMREQGMPVEIDAPADYAMTFAEDGGFTTEGFTSRFRMNLQGMEASGVTEASAGSGCWAAEAGRLHLCYGHGAPRITVTVSMMGVEQVVPAPGTLPDTSLGYECAGDAVVTRADAGDGREVVTTLRRR